MHPESSRAHLHPKLPSISLFPLLLPPERERDYLSHRWEGGGGVTDGPPDVWPKHVTAAWRSDGGRQLRAAAYEKCRYVGARLQQTWAVACLCSVCRCAAHLCFLFRFSARLLVTPPSCCSTAGRPTLPSCHWGSPRPLRLAGLALGRSPTSPPWQLLPSAAPSQTVLGSGKVTPPATVWGRWGGAGVGVARRVFTTM